MKFGGQAAGPDPLCILEFDIDRLTVKDLIHSLVSPRQQLLIEVEEVDYEERSRCEAEDLAKKSQHSADKAFILFLHCSSPPLAHTLSHTMMLQGNPVRLTGVGMLLMTASRRMCSGTSPTLQEVLEVRQGVTALNKIENTIQTNSTAFRMKVTDSTLNIRISCRIDPSWIYK